MKPTRGESVTVQYAASRRGVPASGSIRHWAHLALGARRGAITVRIVDEREGAALNRRYRGRTAATNVLSFPAEPLPDGRRPVLGDVVIAAPVVAREAAAQHKPPRAHWAHLVIHGCLHLLGYDHQAAAEAAKMEALERRLLVRLGFPDPYRCDDPA